MLGRFPVRHRVVVWVAGLVTSALAGAWLAVSTPLPLLWRWGAAIGAGLGVVMVPAFLRLLQPGRRSRPPLGGLPPRS